MQGTVIQCRTVQICIAHLSNAICPLQKCIVHSANMQICKVQLSNTICPLQKCIVHSANMHSATVQCNMPIASGCVWVQFSTMQSVHWGCVQCASHCTVQLYAMYMAVSNVDRNAKVNSVLHLQMFFQLLLAAAAYSVQCCRQEQDSEHGDDKNAIARY